MIGRRSVWGEGPDEINQRYRDLSPVHTVNNLALVAVAERLG